MREGITMRNVRIVALFVAAIGFLSHVGVAGAASPITACGQNPGSVDLYLDADISYDWNDAACVTVRDGHSLDMKGKKITCVPGAGQTSCQNPAVLCTGSSPTNSLIKDIENDDNDPTNIEGPASIGVSECGSVQDLKIDGAITGIRATGSNGKSYQSNVIWPSDHGTALDVVLTDGTDRITNNRIDGGNYGIKIVGRSTATGPKIDHNVIRAFSVNGIFNGDATYVRIENNVVVEGGPSSVPFLVQSANASYVHNTCEAGGPCECELDYLSPEPSIDMTAACF